MRPTCRTPGCERNGADELGFCPACRRDYADRRALTAEVCSALYQQHPELFARLAAADAHELAEHLVAHATEGERGFYARFWAGIDFIREARELTARRELARRILVQRRDTRGVPRGARA